MKLKIFTLIFTTFTLIMNAQNQQNLDKKQSSQVVKFKINFFEVFIVF